MVEEKPYKNGPDEMGVFALRSPERPNPIAVSNVNIAYVDVASGTIGLYYIDAFDASKVIDIKPYTPSIDRIHLGISVKALDKVNWHSGRYSCFCHRSTYQSNQNIKYFQK